MFLELIVAFETPCELSGALFSHAMLLRLLARLQQAIMQHHCSSNTWFDVSLVPVFIKQGLKALGGLGGADTTLGADWDPQMAWKFVCVPHIPCVTDWYAHNSHPTPQIAHLIFGPVSKWIPEH